MRNIPAGKSRKMIAVLVSLVLVAALAVSGTLAWLTADTDPVTNTFKAGEIKTTIDETFTDNVKTDVKITNNGTVDGNGVDAYIRAMVVVTWQKDSGDVYATAPQTGDYTITWSGITDNSWFEKDGIYYHKAAVGPGESTSILFTDCKLNDGVEPPAEDYYLCVEIISSAIQALPPEIVETEWSVFVDTDKNLTATDPDAATN